jgi:hypothetical protein
MKGKKEIFRCYLELLGSEMTDSPTGQGTIDSISLE